MSSNKRQKRYLSDTNMRQLFDVDSYERIGEQLSEVILQYLSLEDKVKLESVSKQFQKTIFKRQYELEIPRTYEIKESSDIIWGLDSLLRKCPKVKSFDFERGRLFAHHIPNSDDSDGDDSHSNGSDSNSEFTEEDLANDYISQMVFRLCHNLNEIKYFETECNETFYQLREKFGTKLLYWSCDKIHKSINSFINLKSLKSNEMFGICGLELKMLRQLEIRYTEEDAIHLQKFVEKYKCLTHLTITVEKCDRNGVQNLLNQLLKLKELIHFGINTEYSAEDDVNGESHYIAINDQSFVDSVKQMSTEWTKLKSFGCFVNPIKDSNRVLTKFVPILGFKRLKRLSLWTDYVFNVEELFQFLNYNFIQNLSHLRIPQTTDNLMDESVIVQIEERFPRLKFSNYYFDP